MTIRVCVAGATGWTGGAVTAAILKSSEFQLVGAIARRQVGVDVGEAIGAGSAGVKIVASLEEALAMPTDVLIDYSFRKSCVFSLELPVDPQCSHGAISMLPTLVFTARWANYHALYTLVRRVACYMYSCLLLTSWCFSRSFVTCLPRYSVSVLQEFSPLSACLAHLLKRFWRLVRKE